MNIIPGGVSLLYAYSHFLYFDLYLSTVVHLATCTRPDISAVVSKLSKFSQNPGVPHWEGVKRVLCRILYNRVRKVMNVS